MTYNELNNTPPIDFEKNKSLQRLRAIEETLDPVAQPQLKQRYWHKPDGGKVLLILSWQSGNLNEDLKLYKQWIKGTTHSKGSKVPPKSWTKHSDDIADGQ